MVSQCRYAERRHSSIQAGSFFLPEISRITSSERPGGTRSSSISVTKPYLYSFSVRSWSICVSVWVSDSGMAVPSCVSAGAGLAGGDQQALERDEAIHAQLAGRLAQMGQRHLGQGASEGMVDALDVPLDGTGLG